MTAVLTFIKESGGIGWMIMAVGTFGLALMAERAHVLYRVYRMDIEAFYQKVHNFILQDKPEEALLLCAQMEKIPFAKAFKTILQKSDRDDDSLFQAQDIALSETLPLFSKRLHYLSMIANVATLMGLLGTIWGLILSFNAVAQADPSQKQALLAQGISVSMYTTALGLLVAVPVMIGFSILVSRQNYLSDQLTEKSSKLVEALTSTHLSELTRKAVYPDNLAVDQVAAHKADEPPKSTQRAS